MMPQRYYPERTPGLITQAILLLRCSDNAMALEIVESTCNGQNFNHIINGMLFMKGWPLRLQAQWPVPDLFLVLGLVGS